jgi:hypothetical protein
MSTESIEMSAGSIAMFLPPYFLPLALSLQRIQGCRSRFLQSSQASGPRPATNWRHGRHSDADPFCIHLRGALCPPGFR